MKVNEYDLRDFNLSEKAIWLVTRWTTPELRLPSITILSIAISGSFD